MDDFVANSTTLKHFVSGMIDTRLMDSCERECLYEAAQKGEKQLLEAMRCIFGREMTTSMIDAAHDNCVFAEFLLSEMEAAQEEIGDEWERRLSYIGGCVDTCEVAILFARREAPELCAQLEFYAGKARQAYYAAIKHTAHIARKSSRENG